MKQLWSIQDVRAKFKPYIDGNINQGNIVDSLFNVCLSMAKRAKDEHSYMNIKGELESSVGVVIIKDRNEIKRWSLLAKSGKDPALGLRDMRNALSEYILGKAELPNGTQIPAKGYAGIVFAAAPYAGIVQNKGRTVLDSFAPNKGYVFQVLNSAIK